MAKLEAKHIFKNNIEKVFAGINNFEQYVNNLPGVTNIEVLPAKVKGSSCQVRYEINIIKTFHYTLNMFVESPKKIWWELSDSNLMKENSGGWDLKDLGNGQTEAIYTLDVKFKGLVPSAVTDKVAKANLPSMFSGFQKIIDN